eukprot:365130-Chlamydomonas_euryale.AAC.13
MTTTKHICEGAPVISDECREDVYKYKISRDANINKNIPLGGQRMHLTVQLRALMTTPHFKRAIPISSPPSPLTCTRVRSQGMQGRRHQILQRDLVLWVQSWPGYWLPSRRRRPGVQEVPEAGVQAAAGRG